MRKQMKLVKNTFKLYAGRHSGTFLGVEKQVHEHGPCLLWTFLITHGHSRTFVNRFTGPDPTKRSDCGIFLSSLLGRPASEIDLPDVNSLIGRSYSIIVQYHDGYPRIENIQPASNPILFGRLVG